MNSAFDLHIEGMTCAACSSRIERVLAKIPGVTAQVSLLEHRARISGLPVDDAIATIRRAGYDAWPVHPESLKNPSEDKTGRPIERFRDFISAIALVIMLAEMGAMFAGKHGFVAPWLQLVLASLMQFLVAWPFYQSALRALRGGAANMETLVSLGTLSAYGWSVYLLAQEVGSHGMLYFEASVVVIAMVRLGRALERRARRRALEAIESLIHLETAPVEAFNESKACWERIDPQSIGAATLLRIHPNERLSLDGVICKGATEIDESSMTGESMPATRTEGMNVFAGCMNLTGTIEVRTTGGFHESRRALIGARILSALSTRAPIAALADRIAAVFVPTVLVIALISLGVHLWLGSQPSAAIAAAVAVLVVACPCALGLATPAAIAAGLARAAGQGWLFQSADALQRAASIDMVVFDKTGTLTSGRPSIKDLSEEGQSIMGQWPDWLAAAASAERGVEHPLAGALLSYAAGRPMPQAGEIKSVPGSGVTGVIRLTSFGDDAFIHVGKPNWVSAQLQSTQTHHAAGPSHDDASEVHVAINGKLKGKIWISDSIKQDALGALNQLKKDGYSVRILSGDRSPAVKAVAKALGNVAFEAEQTPEQKTEKIHQWKAGGSKLAMVGDGINDAAAMSHADLGIAMAAGANLTIEAADLTIANASQLSAVGESLMLARKTMRRVRENLAFAFVFNILAIPAAAAGKLSPVIAGSAMALSSALVLANALRLLQGAKKSRLN